MFFIPLIFLSAVSNLINEIHFTPEVVFQLPTDGVNITAIAGSANGRIFLGGEDGNLYEIQYRVRFHPFLMFCTESARVRKFKSALQNHGLWQCKKSEKSGN